MAKRTVTSAPKSKKTTVSKTKTKTKKVAEPEKKKYKDDIFGFMKIAITDQNAFDQMSNTYKRRFAFMLNRFCSIKYPVPAATISRVGISDVEIVNYWQSILKRGGSVPGWIFQTLKNTKSKKEAEAVKKTKTYYPDDKTIKKYCSIYKLDSKTFDETMALYRNEFIAELKEFEYMLKGSK